MSQKNKSVSSFFLFVPTEIGLLPSFARDAVGVKKAVRATMVPGSIGSPVPPVKKARKTQSNGKAKGAKAKPIQMLSAVPSDGVGSKSGEEAMTQGPDAGAQEGTPATLHTTTKAQKTSKASKTGATEKKSKKRKLATGDAGLGEPKGKKLKVKSGLEVPEKKKKKSKSSSSIGTPKKKEGKEKKSNKSKIFTLCTCLQVTSMLTQFPHP